MLQELTELVLFFLLSPDRPTSFTCLGRMIFLSMEVSRSLTIVCMSLLGALEFLSIEWENTT